MTPFGLLSRMLHRQNLNCRSESTLGLLRTKVGALAIENQPADLVARLLWPVPKARTYPILSPISQ